MKHVRVTFRMIRNVDPLGLITETRVTAIILPMRWQCASTLLTANRNYWKCLPHAGQIERILREVSDLSGYNFSDIVCVEPADEME